MIDILYLAVLAITTIFAVAAASALHWMLLRAIFVLMRPATAQRIPAPTRLAHGTSQLARAYVSHR